MNLCIISEYKCTFDDFKEIVESSSEATKEFISEWELIKVNDHKSIMLVNCSDMEALETFMTTDEMKAWDAENGCVDTLYSMEKIS